MYPELALLDDRAEAMRVAGALRNPVYLKARGAVSRIVLYMLLSMLLCGALVWVVLFGLGSIGLTVRGPWVPLVLLPVFCVGLGFLSIAIFRGYFRKHLWVLLQQQGVAVCTGCGYDLRGQTESRCPECGSQFDERLLQGDAASGATPGDQ